MSTFGQIGQTGSVTWISGIAITGPLSCDSDCLTATGSKIKLNEFKEQHACPVLDRCRSENQAPGQETNIEPDSNPLEDHLMCGIFGVIHQDGCSVPDEVLLERSLNLLQHRGPDSRGVYCESGVGLAHTRLSLVDLSDRSRQPFWDATDRFGLVYNGEIYNFRELRSELEQKGAKFRTTSDTEVLLQGLILENPETFVPRLEGMFAFGLYDKQEKTLLLVRDRFGIKPLSIYHDENLFLFASEVKAMRPWISLQPNAFAICSYLLGFDGPMQNSSFYEKVVTLPPGSMVRLRVGEEPNFTTLMTLTGFLDPELSDELKRMTTRQMIDRIDGLLHRSVRQMMFADAPVGVLCSGGIDSSIIAAIAARNHANFAIFHANVTGPTSEYKDALRLSKHLKLDLNAVKVSDQDFIDLAPEVTNHYERPFARHYHSIPFLMVSKLAREKGVKGVLSGEGADECFLGYQQIVREPIEEFYQRQIAKLRQLICRIPKLGAVLWPHENKVPNLVRGLLSHFELELAQSVTRRVYSNIMHREADRTVRTLDLLADHLCVLLHRNDRMGMAASIEARFPFLDEILVKTSINLPYGRKIRFSPLVWERAHPFLRDKWIVRKVADRYLPQELSQRKKAPFMVTAYDRLQIPESYFVKSSVANFFRLTTPEWNYLITNSEQRFKIRLLLLDIWARICIDGDESHLVAENINAHISFRRQ